LQRHLLPTAQQSAQLRATMRAFNAAATYAARVGFEAGLRSQPSLHRLTSYTLREPFGLSSQMAVRAIGKAVECFGRDKTVCPVFRPDGAMTYDPRLMSFKGMDTVSLLTLEGRQLVPLIYGEYRRARFDRLKGQCDLVLRDGQFYLYASITVPDGAPIAPTDFLGVDVGLVNLATDRDGTTHTGAAVERVRRRHHQNRRRLQRTGTRGAKQRLRVLAGREGRFRRHQNHGISKPLVKAAPDTQRGIALEDLTPIRSRTTVRRTQRARHAGWAFHQLRAFVEYKATLAGVPVVLVDPRQTSRTCRACGHGEKANRRSQAMFRCRHCGYSANADVNAARNISGLGRLVTPPQTCHLAAAS
jgi:IS605 OrfB family transposase